MFGFFGKNDGITHTYMFIIYIYMIWEHTKHTSIFHLHATLIEQVNKISARCLHEKINSLINADNN